MRFDPSVSLRADGNFGSVIVAQSPSGNTFSPSNSPQTDSKPPLFKGNLFNQIFILKFSFLVASDRYMKKLLLLSAIFLGAASASQAAIHLEPPFGGLPGITIRPPVIVTPPSHYQSRGDYYGYRPDHRDGYGHGWRDDYRSDCRRRDHHAHHSRYNHRHHHHGGCW
jgi:hypothetical protein